MKLLRLELLAFGSLRDVRLDFASEQPCLHVIYGPNEAGKSTALRALSGFFYGIPSNTPDAHSIEPAKLKLSALLCDARGRELHVVRRKGRTNTLLDANGEPLVGADVSWMTAGVAESTFRSLFGLSFDTLHGGAEELLGSAGDLGQSLFTAAVGGGRVRAVLQGLQAEADALFRPKGRTQPLNAALSAFDAAKKKSREVSKPDALASQQEGIEVAERRAALCDEQLRQLRAERVRLERARRVLPLLEKSARLRNELDALQPLVRLPESAPKERAGAEASRRTAVVGVEHAQAEIAAIERDLVELGHELNPELAALAPSAVEGLRDRLVGYRRCLTQLPRRREALARARADVARVAAQLEPGGAEPADIEGLRVPKGSELRVREHARRTETLRAQQLDLQRTAAARADELTQRRLQLRRLWAPLPRDSAQELPLLTRFALPREETIAAYERTFAELALEARRVRDKQLELAARAEQNRSERETLAKAGAPPSEAELDGLRETRRESWAALRGLLVEQPSDARVLPWFDRAQALTEHSDHVADRLRREAERVFQAAKLEADANSHQRQREQLQAEESALDQRKAQCMAEWSALFRKAGVSVHTPREASARLVEQRALEVQCEQLERELQGTQRELAKLGEKLKRAAETWVELARELGAAESSTAAEVEAQLALRSELLTRHDAASQLQRELAELEQEIAQFEALARELCGQHAPDLLRRGLSLELAADRLIRAHAACHAAQARHQQLTAASAQRRAALEQAQLALAQADRRLQLLMQAAGASDLAGLERAEQRSARRSQLEHELAQLEQGLLEASDGQDPTSVAQSVHGSMDELCARLEEIEDESARIDEERQRALHELTRNRMGVERLRDDHDAGDAALEAASQLENVRALAERYVRLRLAASALKREIARYRDRHRAPVLRAAGELFARLTLHAYERLDVDYGADDEPVLTCVRADGARLSIPALSTGTRDQLYLALRLASIEHMGSQQELMPLILDDVLVHFDDDRARAALAVLGSFAATTQVLFFTHHQRLCGLAQEALPAGRVRLHTLKAPARLSVVSLSLS